MVEPKTIGISTLITLGMVLAGSLIPSYFDRPNYFCESRPEIGVAKCDSLTKYGVENGKCMRGGSTNLICKTGWILVTNDYVFPDDVPEEEISAEIVPSGGHLGHQYICDTDKCVFIK